MRGEGDESRGLIVARALVCIIGRGFEARERKRKRRRSTPFLRARGIERGNATNWQRIPIAGHGAWHPVGVGCHATCLTSPCPIANFPLASCASLPLSSLFPLPPPIFHPCRPLVQPRLPSRCIIRARGCIYEVLSHAHPRSRTALIATGPTEPWA